MTGLAQQIAELEDVQPKEFDPDDFSEQPSGQLSGDGEDGDDPSASLNAAREHYVDVGPSSLRRANQDLDGSFLKYAAVKTSRQQLAGDIEHDDSEDNDSSAHSNSDQSSAEDDDPHVDGDEDEEDDESENSDAMDEDSAPHPQAASKPSALREQDLTSALQASRQADRLKGKAISRQLRLWDSLVDARIKMQKGITITNVLPPPITTEVYRASSAHTSELVDSVLAEALALSEDLFALQEMLVQSQDTKIPPRKKRKLGTDEQTHDQLEQQVVRSTEEFSALQASLHSAQLSTLSKWSAKVNSVAPTALLPSKRASFKQSPAAPKSAVDMIAETLDEGSVARAKLVGRTRVRRGQVQARLGLDSSIGEDDDGAEQGSTGKPHAQGGVEGDAEVFDDTDFYQEILRDVIQSKSGVIGLDPSNSGSLRPPKLKKAIDTKASKGRKLRYEVHEKLQHFMVPITSGTGAAAWHEEQVDELFGSLLGKGYMDGGQGGAVDSMSAQDAQTVGEAIPVDLGGLRVF